MIRQQLIEHLTRGRMHYDGEFAVKVDLCSRLREALTSVRVDWSTASPTPTPMLDRPGGHSAGNSNQAGGRLAVQKIVPADTGLRFLEALRIS